MDNSTCKTRILVIEDEIPVSVVSQRTLSGEGYEVKIALDGHQAQDILCQNNFDLILMDVKIPGMTGMELYEWLKGKYPEKAERVIFTTGDVMSGNTQSFLEQTARPYLAKPFTPVELRTIVKQGLEQFTKS